MRNIYHIICVLITFLLTQSCNNPFGSDAVFERDSKNGGKRVNLMESSSTIFNFVQVNSSKISSSPDSIFLNTSDLNRNYGQLQRNLLFIYKPNSNAVVSPKLY